MDDKKKLAVVLEKEPVALYQVLNALNFHKATEENKERAKLAFGSYIYDTYISTGKDIPEMEEEIVDDIIDQIPEVQEIFILEEQAKHQKYIKEHDLGWVIDVFSEFSAKNNDQSLDYEFVYHWHHDLGLQFSEDPEELITTFVLWLDQLMAI